MRVDFSEVITDYPCARLVDDYGIPIAAASGKTREIAASRLRDLISIAFRSALKAGDIAVMPHGVYIPKDQL